MALEINYSPVGALGSAAYQAGQAQGQQENFTQGLQLQDLDLRRQAQNRAFQLQSAMADRMVAARTRTPAAEHIAQQAGIARDARDDQQSQAKDQLDSMRSDGTIDPGQYQKGLIAVMTGNHELLSQVLAQPKANLSNSEEFTELRTPFVEQRTLIKRQLSELEKSMLEPVNQTPVLADSLKKQHAEATQRFLQTFQDEAKAVAERRGTGHAPPSSAQTAAIFGGPSTGTPPGTASVTPVAGSSIVPQPAVGPQTPLIDPTALHNYMRAHNITPAGGVPPVAPPIGKRIEGMAYSSPTGKVAIWRGDGWEPQ
jgi:hypothetical protein